MTILYSATAGGFYHTAVHGERIIEVDGQQVENPDCKIPALDDLVEVAQGDYMGLLDAMLQDCEIVPGQDGHPMARPRFSPEPVEPDAQPEPETAPGADPGAEPEPDNEPVPDPEPTENTEAA